MASITNPFSLATSYFPPRFHWIPEHGGKTVQYYSDILCHENSITIKAITDKVNTTKIIYHNVFLNHIISEEMWGPNPATTRRLPKSLFPIHIMIISLPGSNLCSIKMKICLILGLLILIKISIMISPFGSSASGLSLAQLLKYS